MFVVCRQRQIFTNGFAGLLEKIKLVISTESKKCAFAIKFSSVVKAAPDQKRGHDPALGCPFFDF